MVIFSKKQVKIRKNWLNFTSGCATIKPRIETFQSNFKRFNQWLNRLEKEKGDYEKGIFQKEHILAAFRGNGSIFHIIFWMDFC